MKQATLNRTRLVKNIRKRMRNSIRCSVINDIISLFIEEFNSELINKKEVDIPGFGVFSLEYSKPRKYHDFQQKKMFISKSNPLLKFRMTQKLKNKILENLDILKTFG